MARTQSVSVESGKRKDSGPERGETTRSMAVTSGSARGKSQKRRDACLPKGGAHGRARMRGRVVHATQPSNSRSCGHEKRALVSREPIGDQPDL